MDLPKEIGCNEESAIAWASLPALRVFLIAAGVCNKWEFPNIAAEWAASGDLTTRAKMLFIDAKLERDAAIPPLAWRYALDECGIDWRDSNLNCTGVFKRPDERLNLRARGVEVSLTDLRNLLLLDDEVYAAEIAERYTELTSDARPARTRTAPPKAELTAAPAVGSTAKERKGAKPGPKIDTEWKDKVFAYCDRAGGEFVASPELGGRQFWKGVKDYYGLGQNDEPKDYRRTEVFRQQWLDRRAAS